MKANHLLNLTTFMTIVHHLTGSLPTPLYTYLPDHRLVCWRCLVQQQRRALAIGFRAVKRNTTTELNGRRHNPYQPVEVGSTRMASSRSSPRILSTSMRHGDKSGRKVLAHRMSPLGPVRPPLPWPADYKRLSSETVGYICRLLV